MIETLSLPELLRRRKVQLGRNIQRTDCRAVSKETRCRMVQVRLQGGQIADQNVTQEQSKNKHRYIGKGVEIKTTTKPKKQPTNPYSESSQT